MTKGKYIVFEGMDGGGKSTAIRKTVSWLNFFTSKEVIFTKEAGGTPIGKKIRDIILYNTASDDMTDILLFLADRNENKHRIILPNIDKGNYVLCDRNYYSSLVYQGLMNNKFDIVYDLHIQTGAMVEPDVLFLFDLDPKLSMSRISKGDKFEMHDIEYFTKVRQYYKEVVQKYSTNKCEVKIIDASKNEDAVFEEIKSFLTKVLFLEKS